MATAVVLSCSTSARQPEVPVSSRKFRSELRAGGGTLPGSAAGGAAGWSWSGSVGMGAIMKGGGALEGGL